jgi:hypothetical protein
LVEKLNKMKLECLKEENGLRILEKQITNLEDQIMLMDLSGMDEIARQCCELLRYVIMEIVRDREAIHVASTRRAQCLLI